MANEAQDGSWKSGDAGATLRDHFLAWQCRVRQYAVRHGGGRPSRGRSATHAYTDVLTDLSAVLRKLRRSPGLPNLLVEAAALLERLAD